MVCGTVLAIFIASAVYISHGKQEKKNVLTTSSGGLRFSRALQEVVPLSWLGKLDEYNPEASIVEKGDDEMKSDDDHQEDDPALQSLRILGRWKQHKKKMREEKKKAWYAVIAEAQEKVEPSTTTAGVNTAEVSLDL